MKNCLNTLYVTSPDAYLRLQGDTICVELNGEKVLQVPLHHIGSVVCFGDVVVTPAVMKKCTSTGKSIAFLDRTGAFAARVEGPISGNVLLRIDQYRAQENSSITLSLAKNMVAGKIHNSRQIALRGGREADNVIDKDTLDRTSDLLGQMLKKVKDAQSLDELRGFEGESARVYFSSMNSMMKHEQRKDFAMVSRQRRPPRDRINALLSFLYTLLTYDCRAALECVGLDPQVGFLHCLRPGRPALALDLAEEFRSIIADRVTLTLINRCQLRECDFEIRPGGAVRMTDEARKVVISTYQKRKQEEILHPLVEEKVSIGMIIHLQARLLARTIRQDMDEYIPFIYR